jgi:hypothetical protein
MATSTFNLIEDSELESSANATRLVVKGMITGITADSGNDQEILWRALQACAAAGYVINAPLAGHGAVELQRIVLRGFTNDGVYVWLYYETPNFGGTPVSALLVRDRQSMVSNRSNSFVDANGKRRPITVRGGTFLIFQGIDVSNAVTVDSDIATIDALDPCWVIEVSGLTYGARSNSGRSIFGRVNSDNFQGLGPGYWLCTENETDISRYASYFSFSFAAASRVTKDWSEIAFLRSELTGKFIQPTDEDINVLNSGDYVNDIVQVDGGTRVGRYPMAAYAPVFGGVL